MQESVHFAPEMFHNPKQTGVARRFFQKQRLKQMMKQNNLEVNRVDSDCNSSTVYKPRSANHLIHSESELSSAFDSSYLGISNKVNNTNIHVDSVYNKHLPKSLTPELLCVLGPPKETCSIVSSTENDQHQWPLTSHQCGPYYYHPKHVNISRSPMSLSQVESKDNSNKNNLHSPSYFTEERSQSLNSNEESAKYQRDANISLRTNEQRASKNKRKKIIYKEQEEQPDPHITSPQLLPSSAHLLEVAIPPLNLSHGSSTPPMLMEHHYGAATEMEWLHLLNKKKMPNERESLEAKMNYTDESSPYFDDLCCSEDEESVEGVALEWEKELEGRVVLHQSLQHRDQRSEGQDATPHPPPRDPYEERSEGDGSQSPSTSSVGTSLVPEVDRSPPPSLPVSDSPFDSPVHHKFHHHHQNTPDSISLDSNSLLSPTQHHSHDTPMIPLAGSQYPLTPTLTLTASTPVNTPVTPSSPSSRDSPATIQRPCNIDNLQEDCALLPMSNTTETLTLIMEELQETASSPVEEEAPCITPPEGGYEEEIGGVQESGNAIHSDTSCSSKGSKETDV